ncbi:hypothetical protein BHE74_00049891 [Ensete ventricosum]|nr:hypothetical protein BHE74_00049891 [Ensete ventricosum]
MDLNALRRKPRMPSRKNTSAAGAGSSPLEVEEIRMEITTKRPVESLAPDQATTGQPRKLVKIAGPGCGAFGDPHGEQGIPPRGGDRQAEDGGGPQIADRRSTANGRALGGQCQAEVGAGRTGSSVRAGDKELNELREDLAESQRLIKEQKADRHKANDELLSLMRDNEALKAELPSKSIVDYKQSVGFEWGLRRMGQVSYKYGYRVTMARFQARYPTLKVDIDPFTEKPEDSSVPMETY